jgi:ABC-2 type transport system ATP-binding protein
MNPAISITGLRREFGRTIAVRDLTFDLPTGGVIGLVGPNGSGKSTLIRMLLGLIRPTSGTAAVLGHSIKDRVVPSIGALVESPSFIPNLSAHRNLLSLAHLGGFPSSRVDEVLRIVGLHGRERDAVRKYSLGMKQRLGIAAALLPNPQLLILDEPTNGLDPAGIVEIRSLLERLATEGRTIVVSSHLLSEIETICDHIVVVRFGELIFAGPLADLVARTSPHVEMRPEHQADIEKLAVALRSNGFSVVTASNSLQVTNPPDSPAQLNQLAHEAGVSLAAIVSVQPSLEEIFLSMTGDNESELAAQRAGQQVEVTK